MNHKSQSFGLGMLFGMLLGASGAYLFLVPQGREKLKQIKDTFRYNQATAGNTIGDPKDIAKIQHVATQIHSWISKVQANISPDFKNSHLQTTETNLKKVSKSKRFNSSSH